MTRKITLLLIAIFTVVFMTTKSSAQITDLNAIKALYSGSTIELPAGTTLNGVCISDTVNKNAALATDFIEAQGTGIQIYYGKGAPHQFNVGDSINLDVSGDTLKLFNGGYEIVPPKGSTFSAAVAHNINVTPTPVSVYDLINNLTKYASMLVVIQHAGVNVPSTNTTGTYSGSNNIADNTGSMILYTSSKASFATSTPVTDTMDYVGYMTLFKAKGATTVTPEFIIRSLADILWPLPVAFKSFIATTKGLNTLLTWNTANETSTNKIVVEKSLDGITYLALTSVTAKGKTSNNYTYTDATNKIGTVAYYRLKSVENDGSFKYSNVQKVTFLAANKLSVYPNPAGLTTKLSYPATESDVVARIVTVDGKLVKQVILKAGTTATDINVASLATGTYYIETTNGGESVSFLKK